MSDRNLLIEALSKSFLQLKRQMALRINENLSEGITLSQLMLLKQIESGSNTIRDLSNILKISPPAASKLVEQLFSLGLIERVRSKEDRRIVFLQLTPKGAKNLEINEKIRNSVLKDQLSVLSTDEVEELARILEKVASKNL